MRYRFKADLHTKDLQKVHGVKEIATGMRFSSSLKDYELWIHVFTYYSCITITVKEYSVLTEVF